MIRKATLGPAIALTVVLISGFIGLTPAAACNRTAGCAMDVIQEDRAMMSNGKMEEAIAAGRANVEAFNRLRDAGRAAPSKPVSK